MRDGTQQVHVDFWNDVPTHRDVIRLGERRHAPPGGDTTNAAQVNNGDIGGARLQQPVELGQLVQVLARGHWNEQVTGNGRQPGDVFMLDGVFEPGDASLLHRRDQSAWPAELSFGGVDQDADIRISLLQRLDPDAPRLSLWARLMAQAHFDGCIPVRHMATG